MDGEKLQQRINEIEAYLSEFKRLQAKSEQSYQRLLERCPTSNSRALLTQKHASHVSRQNESISRLERLHQLVQGQLARLENIDL